MASNRLVLSGFNDQFTDFVEDILTIFPTNKDILTAKTSISYLRKLNPTIIIGFWKGYIIPRYAQHIEAGDCAFFLNKDYSIDIDTQSDGSNSSEILNAINRIRSPLSNLSTENLSKCIQYLQNLTKLAMLYDN